MALNNAAWLHNEAGSAKAVDYARRAYERAPDSPAVLDTYGWILVARGDRAAGLGHLRAAARDAPQDRDIQYHLAYALAETGDKNAARGVLEPLLGDGRSFANRELAEALLKQL
jgi:predicted Zn-dependent protease